MSLSLAGRLGRVCVTVKPLKVKGIFFFDQIQIDAGRLDFIYCFSPRERQHLIMSECETYCIYSSRKNRKMTAGLPLGIMGDSEMNCPAMGHTGRIIQPLFYSSGLRRFPFFVPLAGVMLASVQDEGPSRLMLVVTDRKSEPLSLTASPCPHLWTQQDVA